MKKKRSYIYLGLIILLGITLIVFYSNQKEVLDGDELYSYTLSNSKKHGFMVNNIQLNEWNRKNDIKNVFALNNNEIFSLISIYKNQASDVHPPFYYLIFHTMSIFFLNKFSLYPGLIINMICYIVLMVYLFKLAKQLVGKESYIPCILYTISLGMLSTAMFIRMYMMVTCLCVMFTYYFLCITKKMDKRNMIMLSICTYMGFMTHYFFLVYAFFMSLIYLIYLLTTKKKKNILNFMKTMLIPVGAGFITFPFAYKHIMMGYRGEETMDNLITSNIVENFKRVYDRLNKDLFNNIMPIILMLLAILTVVLIKKNYKKINHQIFIVALVLSTILYFTLTLKIIPIMSTRYFYQMYPITILIMYYIMSKSINNKYVKGFLVLVLLLTSLITQIKDLPSWIVKNNYANEVDKNVIYFVEKDYKTISDSQYLLNYSNVYFTNKEFDNYDVIDKSEKEIIVKTDDLDMLDKILLNTKYTKYEKQEMGNSLTGYLLK